MGKIIIKKSFIVWGILVVVLGLISCEKEKTVGEDLMGTWHMPQPLNHRTARRSVEDVGRHSLSAWNYSQIVTSGPIMGQTVFFRKTAKVMETPRGRETDLFYGYF